MGNLKTMRYLIMLFWDVWHIYFMYFVYILCIAHPFCVYVCGDDWIIRYPGADDLTSEPGDA